MNGTETPETGSFLHSDNIGRSSLPLSAGTKPLVCTGYTKARLAAISTQQVVEEKARELSSEHDISCFHLALSVEYHALCKKCYSIFNWCSVGLNLNIKYSNSWYKICLMKRLGN